jgi:hypothetical protein
MRGARLSAALVGFCMMAEAIFAQKQQVYSNPEFEIRLQVPQQAKLCSTPKSEHDHGFDLLLGGGGAKDCRTDADHRGISVFAFFNALDDTKRLAGLLSIMGCEGYKAPCQPGPPGLAIPGLASATARVDAPKGWVQVVVATQAGEPSGWEPGEPSVNYLFYLQTKPGFLDQDLRVFKTVLETVKLGRSDGAK